jgi:S-adenosylmethionine-diacylgycerolhomoserine-N-methlytransferase
MTAGVQHGVLMDQVYKNQRHIYDATRKFFLLGRDRLIADLAPPAAGLVLEIGCGTGRNLLHAARNYPLARCFGLDISEQMLTTAENAIERQGLSGRVSVKLADATQASAGTLFGFEQFDRVFISYALSMIPGWTDALRQAVVHLKPGGSLHILDFGQQDGLPRWFRWTLQRWLQAFHVTPRKDLADELHRIAVDKNLKATVHPLYRGYALYAVLCGK